MVLRTTGFH